MRVRNIACALTILASGLLPMAAVAEDPAEADGVGILFVLHGEAVVGEKQLSITTGRVEWFTDRPAHDAGKISAAEFESVWRSGLAKPTPNAALVGDSVNAIIELTSLSVDGTTMHFGYEVLRGDLSDAALGETTLFIDSSPIIAIPTFIQ